MKNKVLLFQVNYLPGYKAGGSLRTLANMVDYLGDEFQMMVVCLDRDLGDKKPYTDIKPNEWQQVGKAKVMYLSPQNCSLKAFYALIKNTKPDLVYLNSFFHRVFSRKPLILRKLGLIPGIPFIVAPRGEFSPGAINIKSIRKRFYIFLIKLVGLVGKVVWHASNQIEKEDINRILGNEVKVVIAQDLPSKELGDNILISSKRKERGSLKMLFLSRISAKKNLIGALKILMGVKGNIQFNIYGPIGEQAYWLKCQNIIKALPSNIEANYNGEIEYDKVLGVMKEHDIFFLPTFGENFGYVILEALFSGCPVILSDKTPWINLENSGVGWNIPLSRADRFQEVIQKCVDMNTDEYQIYSKKAREYGLKIRDNKETQKTNRTLLQTVLQKKSV